VNKIQIANSFGKASTTYETDAPVQKWTAMFLRDYINQLDIEDDGDCLEIGCGTGFLTQELLDILPNCNWLVTDLSGDMLQQCKSRVEGKANFRTMDGEHPNLNQKFDLIISSLAFQWFHNLEEGLKRLSRMLKPGGRLVFSTLGENSFQQWRANLEACGHQSGLHDYPALADIQAFQIAECEVAFQEVNRLQSYENGIAFLRALKNIGAQEPNRNYTPLSAGHMRKVIKRLELSGDCSMTYQILIGDIQRRP